MKDTMQLPQKLGPISEIPEDESAPFTASHGEQSRPTPASKFIVMCVGIYKRGTLVQRLLRHPTFSH